MLGRGASAAQGVLDKGVSAAKGAVSGVAVEQQLVMKNLCAPVPMDGPPVGTRLRRGRDRALGRRRLLRAARFSTTTPRWVSMGVQDARLAGAFIATTGLRHVHAQRGA